MTGQERPGSGFTPALGYRALTGWYDRAVRLLTRERRWRAILLDRLDPRPGEQILDVGCGTGTLAILLKRRCPNCRVVGLDPDPDVLSRAREKARAAGAEVEWVKGFAQDAAGLGRRFDKAVASLVFHQVPLAGKWEGLGAMARAVRDGGEIHIADYSRQPNLAMRALFLIVQALDGRENTQPNADGALEDILESLTGSPARPERVLCTPTGAISFYRARPAPAG